MNYIDYIIAIYNLSELDNLTPNVVACPPILLYSVILIPPVFSLPSV